jgi:hypothetical protein
VVTEVAKRLGLRRPSAAFRELCANAATPGMLERTIKCAKGLKGLALSKTLARRITPSGLP